RRGSVAVSGDGSRRGSPASILDSAEILPGRGRRDSSLPRRTSAVFDTDQVRKGLVNGDLKSGAATLDVTGRHSAHERRPSAPEALRRRGSGVDLIPRPASEERKASLDSRTRELQQAALLVPEPETFFQSPALPITEAFPSKTRTGNPKRGNPDRKSQAGNPDRKSKARESDDLFRQGDVGKSWYIIIRGSVNVVIQGRGTVTTLGEGDDFGKLALLNDAPRAATIVLREENCHFLRVDKEDFNRILRDVEANTVRLQEHGKDVLVLERVQEALDSHHRYSVVAGTPGKMVEHLLATRLGESVDCDGVPSPASPSCDGDVTTTDLFLDDFFLTHVLFMPPSELCDDEDDPEGKTKCRKRVVHFVYAWASIVQDPMFQESSVLMLVEEVGRCLREDLLGRPGLELEEERKLMEEVEDAARRHAEAWASEAETVVSGMGVVPVGSARKWKLPPGGQPICLFRPGSASQEGGDDVAAAARIMRATDDIIFRVHCADHTYCTLRFPLAAPADIIKRSAADKLGIKQDDLLLVEVKSSGERVVIPEHRTCVATGLSLNGALFISPKEHLDALTPVTEQLEANDLEGTWSFLEGANSQELAYWITLTDWERFHTIHPYELLYKVAETESNLTTAQCTANLDVFLRRSSELQYWVVTELVLCSNLSKRAQLLRKFIKVAAHCQEYGNMNACLAVVGGLGNGAITRLTHTWEKLPAKMRKVYADLEALTDPSRNHRRYRAHLGALQPPVIPFMPLLLKDMTFAHEGNQTFLDGLVNFEKMHLLAVSLRMLRACRARPFNATPPPATKSDSEIRAYVTSMRVIDNSKILTQLSNKIEPRR
ncbi:unnamed protein product, partial [Darwinula stevensoni]